MRKCSRCKHLSAQMSHNSGKVNWLFRRNTVRDLMLTLLSVTDHWSWTFVLNFSQTSAYSFFFNEKTCISYVRTKTSIIFHFLLFSISEPSVCGHHAVSGEWGDGEGAEKSSIQPQCSVWTASLPEYRPQSHQVGSKRTPLLRPFNSFINDVPSPRFVALLSGTSVISVAIDTFCTFCTASVQRSVWCEHVEHVDTNKQHTHPRTGHFSRYTCSTARQPIAWQQLNVFRHLDIVEITFWGSNWAWEWRRKVI